MPACCDSDVSFSIESSSQKKYYLPFDLPRSEGGIYADRNKSHIDSRQELNTIKKIYERLGEANVSRTIYYSKLYNAVKFFNHSYNEHWTLLKTTLAFTALESLFSDSDKSEVSYKVALRTACFLFPKNAQKRADAFTFIRRGYEIRSLFVHGSDVEKQINKIMKKFETEKGVDWYDFHYHYVLGLSEIVSQCLLKVLLNKTYFDFFTKEKHKPDDEKKFFDNLVLNL